MKLKNIIQLLLGAALSLSFSGITIAATSKKLTVEKLARKGAVFKKSTKKSKARVAKNKRRRVRKSKSASKVKLVKVQLKKNESSFSGGLAFESAPMQRNVKSVKQWYGFIGGYKLNNTQSFLTIIHAGRTRDGKNEDIRMFDPKFRHYYKISSPAEKAYKLQIRSEVVLGLSEASKENGQQGAYAVRLEFYRKFFNGKFTVGTRPYYKGYVSEFKTNTKFKPLPKFRIGHNASMSLDLGGKVFWSTELDTGFNFMYSSDGGGVEPGAEIVNRESDLKGSSYFITTLSWQATKSISLYAYAQQSAQIIEDGKESFNTNYVNVEKLQYYMGVGYTF